MDTPTILWVDLQTTPSAIDISADLGRLCSVYRVRQGDRLADSVRTLQPCAIFFEYDEPRPDLLEPLRRCTRDFSAVPVVMITQQHSEKLAVWALRARAWDYLIKRVDRSYLMACLEFLVQRDPDSKSLRDWREHAQDLSPYSRLQKTPVSMERCRPCSEHPAESQSRLTPALAFLKIKFR